MPVASVLAAGAVTVRGQSALDGFDPNANDTIRVVLVQQDGKVLIGGTFTTLSPNGGGTITRNRIARLNTDGTLDTAFGSGGKRVISFGGDSLGESVFGAALQPDGKIVLAGGSDLRAAVARLNPNGSLDTTFSGDGKKTFNWAPGDFRTRRCC